MQQYFIFLGAIFGNIFYLFLILVILQEIVRAALEP
jgi:hypothetical protein